MICAVRDHGCVFLLARVFGNDNVAEKAVVHVVARGGDHHSSRREACVLDLGIFLASQASVPACRVARGVHLVDAQVLVN